MTKDQELARVKVIYLERIVLKKLNGGVYQYFRWMGYYREGGKRKRVYIGRELPQRMRHLAKPGKYTTPEMFDDLCVNSQKKAGAVAANPQPP